MNTADTLMTAKSKHQLPIEIMAQIIAECDDRRTLAALERASSTTRDLMEWHGLDSLWLAACRKEFGEERTTWKQCLYPWYSVKEIYQKLLEPDLEVEQIKANIERLELRCTSLQKKSKIYRLVINPFQKFEPRGDGLFVAMTMACNLLTLPLYVPLLILEKKNRDKYHLFCRYIVDYRELLPANPREAT